MDADATGIRICDILIHSAVSDDSSVSTFSIIGVMEAQADYIAEVVAAIAAGRGRLVGVRREVAEAHDEEMQSRLATSAWSGCTSWYVDGPRITTNWPGLVAEYQDRTRTVDWDALEVS